MKNMFSSSNNVYVSQPISLLPWVNPDPGMQVYNFGIDNTIVITP